ncbi:MAG: adenylate cyclase, partial [Flavobacteriales bacterium]|nr:adenylate cyclase [Flavobacteriales bacterium]
MSSDIENEYFSDGVTEEIINALAKIESLNVTSRTSSFFFKNKNFPINQIGKELNVLMLLEGSVRKSGNDVRITAQLVNVEDGFHYWSETYNHQLDDIFKVQDQISNKVAHKIREYLGHFNYEEQEFVREESAEAYEYFLKSRFNFNKFQKEDISLALEQIDLAIEAEPRNSRYYAAKGIYCGYMAIMKMVPFDEAFKLSKTAAEKALSIDSTDPEAHYSMLV